MARAVRAGSLLPVIGETLENWGGGGDSRETSSCVGAELGKGFLNGGLMGDDLQTFN